MTKKNNKFVLYTYCIPHDDGAAPNPFWGVCTLAICKPQIRKFANIGDWVVGTGSHNSPIGDISKYIVYAMKITKKMSIKDYDSYCKVKLVRKIPSKKHKDWKMHKGDCIYYFNNGKAMIRGGVHKRSNEQRDLSGQNVLISDFFYYFGNSPIELPKNLLPIIKYGRGHKSKFNMPFANKFVTWIEGLRYKPNKLYGWPQEVYLDKVNCGTNIKKNYRGICEGETDDKTRH